MEEKQKIFKSQVQLQTATHRLRTKNLQSGRNPRAWKIASKDRVQIFVIKHEDAQHQ